MGTPNPKCPDCGMDLTNRSYWSEINGIWWETFCEYCGWEED